MRNPRSISLSYSEVNIRFETTPFGNVKLSHCYEYTPLYHDATFKNDFSVKITEWSQFTALISCIMLLKLWTCWKTTTHNVLYFLYVCSKYYSLIHPIHWRPNVFYKRKAKLERRKRYNTFDLVTINLIYMTACNTLIILSYMSISYQLSNIQSIKWSQQWYDS